MVFNRQMERRDSRMKVYTNDINKIVKMVVGSSASAAAHKGQGSKGVINSVVAKRLDDLIEVSVLIFVRYGTCFVLISPLF